MSSSNLHSFGLELYFLQSSTFFGVLIHRESRQETINGEKQRESRPGEWRDSNNNSTPILLKRSQNSS